MFFRLDVGNWSGFVGKCIYQGRLHLNLRRAIELFRADRCVADCGCSCAFYVRWMYWLRR